MWPLPSMPIPTLPTLPALCSSPWRHPTPSSCRAPIATSCSCSFICSFFQVFAYAHLTSLQESSGPQRTVPLLCSQLNGRKGGQSKCKHVKAEAGVSRCSSPGTPVETFRAGLVCTCDNLHLPLPVTLCSFVHTSPLALTPKM